MCIKSHWSWDLGRASDCIIQQEGLERQQQPAGLYLCRCHGIVAPVTQTANYNPGIVFVSIELSWWKVLPTSFWKKTIFYRNSYPASLVFLIIAFFLAPYSLFVLKNIIQYSLISVPLPQLLPDPSLPTQPTPPPFLSLALGSKQRGKQKLGEKITKNYKNTRLENMQKTGRTKKCPNKAMRQKVYKNTIGLIYQ